MTVKVGCCGFPMAKAEFYRRFPVVDPLRQAPATHGLRYFRLHGITGYRRLHTDNDLQALPEWCASGTPTYVLFNTLLMGEDALRFHRLLEGRRREQGGPPQAHADWS